MSRFIPPHPKKGSPEAKAWAVKMRKARKAKAQRNPGARWHVREADAAHRVVRSTRDQDEKLFVAGVETAHRVSASAAKRMGMNPTSMISKRYALQLVREKKARIESRLAPDSQGRIFVAVTRFDTQKTVHFQDNPLAVFSLGNPPTRINTGVAGVIYSRCLEIRAEKTNFKPGLYRHPFSRKSGVQILALDSGDLLVHSTRRVNLWKPV